MVVNDESCCLMLFQCVNGDCFDGILMKKKSDSVYYRLTYVSAIRNKLVNSFEKKQKIRIIIKIRCEVCSAAYSSFLLFLFDFSFEFHSRKKKLQNNRVEQKTQNREVVPRHDDTTALTVRRERTHNRIIFKKKIKTVETKQKRTISNADVAG